MKQKPRKVGSNGARMKDTFQIISQKYYWKWKKAGFAKQEISIYLPIYLSIISKISYIKILAVTTDGWGYGCLLYSFCLCPFSKLSAMRRYRFLIRRNPKGYF